MGGFLQEAGYALPMVTAFEYAVRVNQNVGNVLYVADFTLAFAHFEQGIVPKGQ